MSALAIRLSSSAESQLADAGRQRAGRLRQALHRHARLAVVVPSGLALVCSPMDVAACEVLAERGVLLVYAVASRRELLNRLWGEEVFARIRARRLERLIHGRGVESVPAWG